MPSVRNVLEKLGLRSSFLSLDWPDGTSIEIIAKTIEVKVKAGCWPEIEAAARRLGLFTNTALRVFWVKADLVELEDGGVLNFRLREDSWTKHLARKPEFRIKTDCIEWLESSKK